MVLRSLSILRWLRQYELSAKLPYSALHGLADIRYFQFFVSQELHESAQQGRRLIYFAVIPSFTLSFFFSASQSLYAQSLSPGESNQVYLKRHSYNVRADLS